MRWTEITEAGKRQRAAWHGSPHRIEKFSTVHMGTGEGAQAYGWGLYFASVENVAQYYRDTLSQGCTYDGMPIDLSLEADDPHAYAISLVGGGIIKSQQPPDTALKAAVEQAESTIEWMSESNDRRLSFWQAVAQALEHLDASRFKINRTRAAHVYRVSLPVGPFLDWDKSFKDQARATKIALRKLAAKYTSYLPASIKDNDTGETIYRGLGNFNRTVARIADENKASSLDLLTAGIKGICYLDQGSRDCDVATHNFVIFNGDDVSIEALTSSDAE